MFIGQSKWAQLGKDLMNTAHTALKLSMMSIVQCKSTQLGKYLNGLNELNLNKKK